MASSKFSWVFELFDKLSGPSERMANALDAVDKELAKTTRAMKELDKAALKTNLEKATDPLKRQRMQLQLNRMEMEGSKAVMQGATMEVEGLGAAFSEIAGPISMAVAAIGGLAAAGGALTYAGTKWVVDTANFKEQTMTSLKVMLGTEEAANRIFNEAITFAARTPFETKDVVKGYTQLLGAGFKKEDLATVFAAIGDAMSASGGDTQVGDMLTYDFAKIKGEGKLTARTMQEVSIGLARTGVGMLQIYEQLGKVLGKNTDEIRRMEAAGQIDANTGIYAIIKALEARSGGAVGNIMAEQSKTLGGLWSTLVSAPSDLILRADVTHSGGYNDLKDTISNLIKLMDAGSDTGQKMQAVILGLANDVMEAFLGPSANGFDGMHDKFMEFLDAVDNARPALRGFFSMLAELAKDTATSLIIMGNLFNQFTGMNVTPPGANGEGGGGVGSGLMEMLGDASGLRSTFKYLQYRGVKNSVDAATAQKPATRSVSVNVDAIHINAPDASDPEQHQKMVEQHKSWLADAFDQIAGEGGIF